MKKTKQLKNRCENIVTDLQESGISSSDAERAAPVLIDKGWRRVSRGTWMKDETYKGTNKVVYRCSVCGHWQTQKKWNTNDGRFHMNYCPFCGSAMKTASERKEK